MEREKNYLIVAIHFDIKDDDLEFIQDVLDKLKDNFENIKRVDLLNDNDYHADVS